MKLAGKVALVTGASNGIGYSTAVELAKAGANVGINYYSDDKGANSCKTEIESHGRQAMLLKGDVSSMEFVDGMVADLAGEFGRLDLFVSNAVYSDREKLVEANMEGFRRTINVSMMGAVYGVRAAAKQMIAQDDGGAMVIVSSPHAKIPFPGAMAYNMAKAALDHMGRTAAIELAEHRIRVNIMHPGWIDTPGERKFFSEEDLAQGAGNIPWDRLGTPSEIGRAITYLLSEDADYMTGSTMLVDGGISLPWWSKRDEGKQ